MGWLFKLLTGGLVSDIGDQLNKAYSAKLAAKNSTEQHAASVSISTLEARKSVLLEESNDKWNRVFRVFLALPFGIFVWKVVVVDKVLRLGVTDPLDDNMWKLLATVYGFYFVYETAMLFKKRK